MNSLRSIGLLLFLFFIISGFYIHPEYKYNRKKIAESKQRTGDASKGYKYLVEGDYVSSGIPYDLFKNMLPKDTSNVLQRSGINEQISPQFNLIEHKNGTKILAPNCLTCHSESINGDFIIGLGNNSFDYTFDASPMTNFLSVTLKNKFGTESSEWEAFQSFHKASQAIGPQIITDGPIVNPADKLTAVLVAHRDPETLEWNDKAQLDIPEVNIPTDVPPWWLLKKKHAMFYTAIGRGDFSKFLMASSILTLTDTTEARKIDSHFPDVLAWINELEAPKYPGNIDQSLLLKGKRIFELNCEQCHGKYGKEEEYPNLLIQLDEVGTDPYLSNAYSDGLYSEFVSWYEKSWFAQSPNGGKVVIEGGYVAPPLDGIWASAPYLHNGSVPTIEQLLNSKERPKYWKWSNSDDAYDTDAFGLRYVEVESKLDKKTYDTTMQGYQNTGHTFGDDLDNDERRALIEYLKTL